MSHSINETIYISWRFNFEINRNLSHRRPSFQNDSSRASTPLPITNGTHETNGHSSSVNQEPQDVFIQPKPPAPKKIEQAPKKEEPTARKSPDSSGGMDFDEDDETLSNASIESVSKRGRKVQYIIIRHNVIRI